MALVSDIQLQSSAVKPPNLDTSLKFSAEGLTATTAFAVTDGGAGTTVTPLGLITAQSDNNVSSYFNTTKTNGDVNLYLNNDENPYWNLKLSATAGAVDSFMIANACGYDTANTCACEYPAFSISPVGAVGIGKTGAASILDITYADSSTGGIVLTESTNTVATKIISLATCSVIGTSSNHKLGFITNNTTRGVFDTSGQLGIGTEAPGAMLDVRGSAIFNEAGADVDFRIEGDTEANLFLVDASTDRIGIGTATPNALLDIDDGTGTGLLLCVNGCICAAAYLGEISGHTIQDNGSDETQRGNLDFVLGAVGTVTDCGDDDATVVCINGANTCIPFICCDGSTSDPIPLTGGSIGNQLANDTTPCLGGTLNGCDYNICCITCITTISNVGIGTSTAVEELHIHCTAAQPTTMRITNATTGATTSDGLEITVNGVGAAIINQKENADMTFSTYDTTRMTIDNGGAVDVVGAFSKGSGSFRIDHPLESKKDTHCLVHSFIEGPQADLIYSGIIQLSGGAAIVNVDTEAGMTDGTFVSLNRCTRVFTTNESNWDAVRGSITDNVLTIESNIETSSACISWMVIGERCDDHMMETDWTDNHGRVIVEPEKAE